MSWDEPHNSFAQKRFVETGGGGALGGEKLRAVLPTELHTLDAALTLSGWGERPNPEWSAPLLPRSLPGAWWSLLTWLCPCCVAAWTAKKLYRTDSPWGHACLCGCLWPWTACQLRQKTREELHLDQLEYGTWGHCDSATVCCCLPCSLTQQAREVYARTRKPPRVRIAPDFVPPVPPLKTLPEAVSRALVKGVGSPAQTYPSSLESSEEPGRRQPRWSRVARTHMPQTEEEEAAAAAAMELSYESDAFHDKSSMVQWRSAGQEHGKEGAGSLLSTADAQHEASAEEKALSAATDALGRMAFRAGGAPHPQPEPEPEPEGSGGRSSFGDRPTSRGSVTFDERPSSREIGDFGESFGFAPREALEPEPEPLVPHDMER